MRGAVHARRLPLVQRLRAPRRHRRLQQQRHVSSPSTAPQSFVSASNDAVLSYIFLDEDLSLLHFIRFQVRAPLPVAPRLTNALSGHFHAALHRRDGTVRHCVRTVERQRLQHRHVCKPIFRMPCGAGRQDNGDYRGAEPDVRLLHFFLRAYLYWTTVTSVIS